MSLRIAVLASGRGSNLDALHRACTDGRIDGRVVGVFSNKPECGAILRSNAAGIHAWAMRPNASETRELFDALLFDAVEAVQPDLIVCAGYMRILGAAAIARFPDRMLNIHPSLLPRHPGLNTHAHSLAAGDTEHGASVHVVIPELDAGPVLAQVRVPIMDGDTPESLAARVLVREHPLLLATVSAVARDELRVTNGGIHWHGNLLASPLQLSPRDTLEAHP